MMTQLSNVQSGQPTEGEAGCCVFPVSHLKWHVSIILSSKELAKVESLKGKKVLGKPGLFFL